ncbi:MAG TPA: hypothetical protein VF338_03805, partial [Leptolinea sp.]
MTDPHYSPELLELFQKGIREIFSPDQMQSFLHCDVMALPSIEKAVLTAEAAIGFQAAGGLFLRSGLAAFKYMVREHGKAIGIDDLDFRLQPQRKRLMDGFVKITDLLDSWQAARFSITKSGDDVEVTIRSYGGSLSISGEQIALHFEAGLFQEYLYWAGG